MENKLFDAIKDQLLEQQAKLSAKADKLRAELTGLDDDRGRIDAALAALAGVDLPSANGKRKHEKRKAFAPSATKSQVVAFIAETLSNDRVMQEEELRAEIETKLVDSGHSRLGYKLRFREALADSQFLKTAEGIQMK